MYSFINLKFKLIKATTNLHVDISDAFNLMIYVANNSDNPQEIENISVTKREKKLFESLIKFDNAQYKRYLNGERPGALWHIFRSQDAIKIREYLNSVFIDIFFSIKQFFK
jgi:lysine-specific demethylase 3